MVLGVVLLVHGLKLMKMAHTLGVREHLKKVVI